MQLRKTVVAVALGFGLLASAQAAPIDNLGTLNFDNAIYLNNYNPHPGGTGNGVPFSNEWAFNVAPGLLNGTATTLLFDLRNMPLFGITDLTFSVFSGTDLSAPAVFKLEFDKGEFFGRFELTSLEYTILVTGTSWGSQGGSYSFGVTAVPEPAEYAMLLAGLGVVGMIARRRKITVN